MRDIVDHTIGIDVPLIAIGRGQMLLRNILRWIKLVQS